MTENGDGTFTRAAAGREHFVGCIKADGHGTCRHEDPSGSWRKTYTFTGLFYDSGQEIRGGCTHPIVPGSGAGDFEGVRDTIFMTDNVTNGTSNVTGSVVLHDQ